MPIPSFLPAVLVLAAAPALAHAEGLVQIVLEGEIVQDGGARIELELAYEARFEGRVSEARTELGLHLAKRTSAADVALLLQRELQRSGAVVIAAPDGGERTRASIFVDHTHAVALRLGRGLTAQLCLCEEAPALVRFLPPKEAKEAARFTLSASTEQPHTKERTRFDYAFDLAAGLSGEQAADVLTTGTIAKGWTGQNLDHQAWRPQSLSSGARVTGTCLALASKGDWRLEVELEHDAPR